MYGIHTPTAFHVYFLINFCLGNPRHSAGSVRSYVRTYVVRIVCNAQARVMEAENSITLTIYSSEHVFIGMALRSDYGFS